MLAGITESVICPAVSHMARVYFYIGALSCIASNFRAVIGTENRSLTSVLRGGLECRKL